MLPMGTVVSLSTHINRQLSALCDQIIGFDVRACVPLRQYQPRPLYMRWLCRTDTL